MPPGRMHADEVIADIPLTRRLLAAQFPHWAELPLAPVPSAGTSNALFRLGHDICLRLPRTPSAALEVDKEQRWLPQVAPLLPLAVPTPLALGTPAHGYPWNWSVYSWLQGEQLIPDRIADERQAATALAEFVAALRRIDLPGGPPPGQHNFGRGVPLAQRDNVVREAIAALGDRVDAAAVSAEWEAALRAPAWDAPPVWLHGDIHAGNLLLDDGRISAVIDFGGLAVGDPAVDLIVAWNLLSADGRAVFRAALEANGAPVDDAMWARGRGWALSVSLIALPYYWDTNPWQVEMSQRTLAALRTEGEQLA